MNTPQEHITELLADGESVVLARSVPRENVATDDTFVLEWCLIRVGRRGAVALFAIVDRETTRTVLPSAQLAVILYRRIDMAPGQAIEQGTPTDWWLWQIAPTPWAAVWNHDDAFFAAESLDGLHAFAVAQRQYERTLLTELETAQTAARRAPRALYGRAGRAEPGAAAPVRARPGGGSRAASQGDLRTTRRRLHAGIAGAAAPRQGDPGATCGAARGPRRARFRHTR